MSSQVRYHRRRLTDVAGVLRLARTQTGREQGHGEAEPERENEALQAFELAVECGEEPEPDELRSAFAAEHERAYGFRDPDGDVELVTLRVTATEPGPEIDAAAAGAAGSGAERSTRRASTPARSA